MSTPAEKGVAIVRRTPPPARAAGLAAAGLAGGLALGARVGARRRSPSLLRRRRRTVLGIPVGREPAALAAARTMAGATRRLADAGGRVSRTAEDVHEVRRQLELSNRQSPVEVLLNGLTHRRGAARAEQ